MRHKLLSTLIVMAVAAPFCFARSTDPVGPAGWTARNWIGLCVQVGLFILAATGIYALAGKADTRRRSGPHPE